MKKKVVFFTILTTLICLDGCGIHWKGRTPEYEKFRYTCSDSPAIHSITIEETEVPVKICTSENDKIYFHYYLPDDDSSRYEIGEEKGTLSVKNITRPNMGIFIAGDESESDSYKEVKFELFLPEDFDGRLKLSTSDSDIWTGAVALEEMKAESYDGDIIFENTVIKEGLNISTRYGDIRGTLAGDPADSSLEMELSAKDGEIQLSYIDGSVFSASSSLQVFSKPFIIVS